MKKRPLCLWCTIILLFGSWLIQRQGVRFIEELRPSAAEQHIKENESVTVSGTVIRTEQKEKNQVIYLKNNSITYHGDVLYEAKLLIYDSTFLQCKIGNKLSVLGTAGFFEHAANPGNFEQKEYYQRQNIHVMIFSEKGNVINPKTDILSEGLAGLRRRIGTYFTEALGERYGNVLSAMLLGDKNGLDPELKEAYQKNGIGHILAISGLHISFLGAGLYSIIRKSGGSYLCAGIIGGAFLVFYVLMIGMGVSAQRAMIMFLIRIGADISGRVYDMATSIAVAAVIIFITQPLMIYDAGFLLSFCAVAGIVTVCPVIQGWLPRCSGKITQSIIASIGIQIVMYPLLLYFFFEIPLYSVLLNIIVIPSMSWVLFASVLGGGISFCIYPLALVFLKHLKWVLLLYDGLCEWAQKLPYARIVLGQPKMWQILLYYAVLIMLVAVGGQTEKFRLYKRKVCTVGGMILVLSCLPVYRQNGNLQIVMLDIGQGDAIFLKNPMGITCLIDGGSSDVKQVGKYRIEPYLKSQGVGTLDYVFVSHGDADHMNGIEELIGRQNLGVKIKCLVLPDEKLWDEKIAALVKKANAKKIKTVTISAGRRIREGELNILCLQPGKQDVLETGNEASMVLSVAYRQFDMLFTGDTEGEGERLLTGKLTHPYDVLKAAHHGSKNSSTQGFLKLAKPRYTLISAGRKNRYGHPHKETLERLNAIGTSVFQTVGSGAIRIETDGEKIFVTDNIRK